jgi:hypothetical protein
MVVVGGSIPLAPTNYLCINFRRLRVACKKAAPSGHECSQLSERVQAEVGWRIHHKRVVAEGGTEWHRQDAWHLRLKGRQQVSHERQLRKARASYGTLDDHNIELPGPAGIAATKAIRL